MASVAAVILAAGYSSRMGEFKPLLPLGDKPVLERVVGLFQEAGIDDVRVVIGHRAADLLPLVEKCHARPIVNEHYRTGMFSSVIAGVRSVGEHADAFFLLPVDIPLVRRRTVEELLRERENSRSRILYPGFRGERGHPPVIPRHFREEILGWKGGGGLKSCLARYEGEAVDVEVTDERILLDMDTPEDYDRLQSLWLRRDIPSFRECEAILDRYAAGDRLAGHCREVEKLSRFLAERLNMAGCNLDLDLVTAGALLHDLAKGRPGHAKEGSIWLKELGYPRVADIVALHMDIGPVEGNDISEKEIVYLADKMILGEQRVSIEARFSSRLKSAACDETVIEAVTARLENALAIRRRVEDLLARPLCKVIKNSA